jgi:hypothetical protein
MSDLQLASEVMADAQQLAAKASEELARPTARCSTARRRATTS